MTEESFALCRPCFAPREKKEQPKTGFRTVRETVLGWDSQPGGPETGFALSLSFGHLIGLTLVPGQRSRELSGTPNHCYFLKSIASTNLKAYCSTNTRRTAVQTGGVLRRCPFSSKLRSQQGAALQMRGILRCELDVYCGTFKTRCTGWGGGS